MGRIFRDFNGVGRGNFMMDVEKFRERLEEVRKKRCYRG